MNIIETMTSINKYGKYLVLLVVLVNLMAISFADSSSAIKSALSDLCRSASLFLTAAIIIMILLAGAIYAMGQIMGAETRARASVWATAMLTGAIIAAVIYLLTPIIITKLAPNLSVPTSGDPCSF